MNYAIKEKPPDIVIGGFLILYLKKEFLINITYVKDNQSLNVFPLSFLSRFLLITSKKSSVVRY